MNDKEAIEILTKMLKERSLSEREREAIRLAIGILGWAKLLEGYVKKRKDARNKRLADLD